MHKTTVKNPWFLSFNDYLIICVIQWCRKGGKNNVSANPKKRY